MVRSDSELAATALLAMGAHLRETARVGVPRGLGGELATQLRAELVDEAARCDLLALRAIRADVKRSAVSGARRAKVG